MKLLYHTPTGTLKPYPRQDDLPVIGLDPEYQVFALVQEGRPSHDSSTHYLQFRETVDVPGRKVTRGWDIVEIQQEGNATTVTMGALRIALGRDVCIAVGAWTQSLTEAEQKFQASTWWDFQPYVRRDHPVVEQFRVALSKTEQQVDQWFAAAKQLDQM